MFISDSNVVSSDFLFHYGNYNQIYSSMNLLTFYVKLIKIEDRF